MFAKFGLVFSQPYVYAIILSVGFLLFSEKIFGRTLFILTFTMIYNTFLKSIWQHPLPAPLEGWAFPSGHMHCAVVFWGWLAVEYFKTWFTVMVIFILCLIGYALVYSGYHYPIDVFGALGFGTFSILIYALLKDLSLFKEKPYRLGILLSFLDLLFIFLTIPIGRKMHLWEGLGCSIGFTIGWAFLQTKPKLIFSTLQKLSVLIIGIVGALILIYVSNYLPLAKPVVIFIQYFTSALWIASCKMIVGSVVKQVPLPRAPH